MEERRICENDMIQCPQLEILKVHAENNKRIHAKTGIIKIHMRKWKGADKEFEQFDSFLCKLNMKKWPHTAFWFPKDEEEWSINIL